jgi:hypothetical protein
VNVSDPTLTDINKEIGFAFRLDIMGLQVSRNGKVLVCYFHLV